MSILTEEAAARVAERVRRAEEKTSGELVVALVPSSADYAFWRASAAFLVTVLVALEAVMLFEAAARWVILAQLPLAIALYAVSGRGQVVRLVAPKRVRDASVRQRALAAFVELGVAETAARGGILLFISEREHRVEILADRGIYERLTQERLDAEVLQLVERLRSGTAEAGLARAIDSLGELLAREFPPDGSRNELDDAVRRLPPG